MKKVIELGLETLVALALVGGIVLVSFYVPQANGQMLNGLVCFFTPLQCSDS
jgi:hypothetical protein